MVDGGAGCRGEAVAASDVAQLDAFAVKAVDVRADGFPDRPISASTSSAGGPSSQWRKRRPRAWGRGSRGRAARCAAAPRRRHGGRRSAAYGATWPSAPPVAVHDNGNVPGDGAPLHKRSRPSSVRRSASRRRAPPLRAAPAVPIQLRMRPSIIGPTVVLLSPANGAHTARISCSLFAPILSTSAMYLSVCFSQAIVPRLRSSAEILLFLLVAQVVVGVAADVADGDLGLVALLVDDFDEVLAALLGQRGDDDAQGDAVIGGVEAEVALLDGLLDVADRLLIPRLDGDGAGVGGVDRGDVLQGLRRAIVFDGDALDQGGGLARPVRRVPSSRLRDSRAPRMRCSVSAKISSAMCRSPS